MICSYLGGDLPRIRAALVVGSIIPLISLLAWDAIFLGFSPDSSGAADPFDTGDATALMVGPFSLLAVGTSLIGTLLGFSQFFSEQLRCLSVNRKVEVEDIAVSPFAAAPQREASGERRRILLEDWWVGNYMNLGAMSMAIIPALLVAITVPDAFYLATDIAVTIDQTPGARYASDNNKKNDLPWRHVRDTGDASRDIVVRTVIRYRYLPIPVPIPSIRYRIGTGSIQYRTRSPL